MSTKVLITSSMMQESMSTIPIGKLRSRFAGLSGLTSRIALSSKLEPLCLSIWLASSHVASTFTMSGVTAHNLP
jgi:hypothetical protein